MTTPSQKVTSKPTPNNKREKIFNKYGGRCAYCGCEITTGAFQVDHLLSKRSGGTNDFENLMPSCRSCNNWKTSMSIEQFRLEMERQVDRLRKYNPNFRIAERFGMVGKLKEKVTFHFEESL